MKIVDSINLVKNSTKNSGRYLKTNAYVNDAFILTNESSKSKNIVAKIKEFLNIRKKLHPNSFSVETSNYKGYYVASSESVQLTNAYINSNCLYYDQKIVNGFRDGGRHAKFTEFGDVIRADREIITVDRIADGYLSNAIDYTKENTRNLNEKDKVKFIYNLVSDISGNFEKGDLRSKDLAKISKGMEVLLGKVFENECATCRHKGLMFKILADEVGLNAKMIRGKAFDLSGYGPHVWNEVKLSNGTKIMVDVQNSKVINLVKGKVHNNVDLAGYCTSDCVPVYNNMMQKY